ncbi:VOC family protein [Cohnella nanjingensis]|uniref:VOC family protein n=1 Tax=Cohnella nanjingensis TaxID=1387779 RepID=A0A7X0VFV5_9BACL|nr:VOC family protein [Cohnella nanjingensis]MBB6672206.1 VOC family protein [Cohnella nanjingensis]
MAESAKKNKEENYQPQHVPQSLKVIMGQPVEGKTADPASESFAEAFAGLESAVDCMTLVQLPATRLKSTISFYVDVLGMALEYPDRPLEINTFLQTVPRIGPGLHILETPDAEYPRLQGTVNGKSMEYVALYARSLAELYGRLLQAGARIEREPSDGYISFCDPEGQLIAVYERADSGISSRFQTNINGFRHLKMYVSDVGQTVSFFVKALGFQQIVSNELSDAVYMAVPGSAENQPMIRLVQLQQEKMQPMHWMLNGRPKHALELHSKNIRALRERVLAFGGTVPEDLEFTGCGGYLKFYTPDGHYIWVNQDRRYCDY